MNKSSIIAPLFLLSTLFYCFTVCSSVYRVFIRRCELVSYFEGTQDFDAIKGHHVDILRHGEVFVLSDGSLQLSTNDSDSTEGGSGMMPLFPTGNPLPTIPSDVGAVTISWHANEMVNYSLQIEANPEDHFRMLGVNVSLSGTIPLEKSGFQLKFECHPASTGRGQLNINLTTVSVSTGESLIASFHLDKICEGLTSSGSGLPLESSVLDVVDTTLTSLASLPSTSTGQTTTRIRSSPIPSHLRSFSPQTSDSAAIQTTFLPSSVTSTPSLPLSSSTSSSRAVTSSTTPDNIFLMPFATSSVPELIMTSIVPTSSAIQQPSSSQSPSATPSPSPSSSEETTLLLPPTPSSPLTEETTMILPPTPFSTPAIVPTTSSVGESPSVQQTSRSSDDMVPTPSTETPIEPSSTEVETTSPSFSPLPSPGKAVNGTRDVEELSRLAFLLVIVFAPVVGVLLFVICIMICCICCCACRRKKQPKRGFSDDPLDLPVRYSREVNENELEESFSKNAGPPLTLWMSLMWGTVSSLPAAVQSIIKHYTIDRRSLSILSTVSREDSGAIVKGQWCVDSVVPVGGNKGVMMKMLTGFQKQYGHRDEIVQFVEQATLLRGRDHPNIQKVLKVSVEDNYIPLVVYPIVEYGNLHQFLTFCRISPNESPLNPVTIQYKVNFARQIVSAMYFLSEEGIIHPDLALRNCLLDTGYNVKISDGALSQLFFPECYYNVKGTVRPVRWAAIESLNHGQCTSASNVWSYGVTVWEILTLAEMPYSDVDNNRGVFSSLMMGQRLPQPPDCPDTLYDVLTSCWQQEPMERPTFDALQSQIDAISGRYTPVPISGSGSSTPAPVTMTVGSRQSTPDIRHEAIQHTSAPVLPQPQYVPIAAADDDDDDEVFGAPQDRKNSAVSLGSRRSRDSLQPDKLSITFSVLSGDMLEERGGSSSESEGEGEKDAELIEVLAPELLDRFMPSLRRDQPGKGEGVGRTSNEVLSKPVLTLTSPSVGTVDHLEDTLRYHRLPNTALSPGPFSTSTLTSRLSPSETSSQYGHSTVRSDETPVPPMSSPSPDLTSKTSTLGDETLSTASNPLLTGTYHMPGAGMLSKTSTMDSVNTAVSASADYNHPPNHVYTPHLNGSQYNGTEYQNSTSSGMSSLSNGHPPGKANGDVIKPTQSPPLQNNNMMTSSSDSTAVLDSKDSTTNSVVLREGVGGRQTSRDSELSRTSFGLGLGDLSSDLLSAFDTWKT